MHEEAVKNTLMYNSIIICIYATVPRKKQKLNY
jgi:hypothetical protein